MKPRVQKILTKLANEEKKKGLKPVQLSMINNIEDELSRGFGSYDFIEELTSEAQERMTKARDILKFDMQDAYFTAEEYIEELQQELKELGVDEPAELKRFKSELGQLDKLISDAESEIKSVG